VVVENLLLPLKIYKMLYQTIDLLAEALCFGFMIYKWVIIIAIFLTWVRADPNNPLVYWINRVTYPLWEWCYQWTPTSLKLFNAYIALLFVIFLHALLPASLHSINLALHPLPSDLHTSTFLIQIVGHALQGLGIVAYSIVWFGIFILAIWFVLTLVSPAANNPIVQVVYMLADPLITPIQRYLPRMQVDLSPLVGIVIFYLIARYPIALIMFQGAQLSAPVQVCVY